jgi:hypothetical protein
LEVLMEAKEEKYTAITFFSLKILGHFFSCIMFQRFITKYLGLDPDPYEAKKSGSGFNEVVS